MLTVIDDVVAPVLHTRSALQPVAVSVAVNGSLQRSPFVTVTVGVVTSGIFVIVTFSDVAIVPQLLLQLTV